MTQSTNIDGASRLIAAALCVSVLTIAGASHAEENLQPPTQAQAMTGYELYVLYRDRSWKWPDGAGRLETEGRRFTAIAGSGEEASWAEGRWVVTDRGRLCLDADWHASAGISPDRTCFEHLIDNGTIYQSKAPAGDWYVFKNNPTEADDEFTKLVRDDLVSAGLEELRSALGPQQLSSAPLVLGVNDNE